MLSAEGLSFKKIIVAIGRTDMRRGIDGLSASIRLKYGMDPMDPGTLFLFCGIKKDRIKGLMWTGDRFILLYIRLSKGRFQWPNTADEARNLTSEEFMRLMDGYTIDSSIGEQRKIDVQDPRKKRKS
ncbi:MAG: IS66 family insertion sequence element accessory protein TnpB [Oribacterium sp.]|nr:IS66 family insertion sequence element accessory protein TnpB [Oribacterium sp.]